MDWLNTETKKVWRTQPASGTSYLLPSIAFQYFISGLERINKEKDQVREGNTKEENVNSHVMYPNERRKKKHAISLTRASMEEVDFFFVHVSCPADFFFSSWRTYSSWHYHSRTLISFFIQFFDSIVFIVVYGKFWGRTEGWRERGWQNK